MASEELKTRQAALDKALKESTEAREAKAAMTGELKVLKAHNEQLAALLARNLIYSTKPIKGSRYKNMKELRVQYFGHLIRAFYAFDLIRRAIVLCADDKSNDKRFYDKLATLKRYIEAMDGKLNLDVELPTGKRIAFHI